MTDVSLDEYRENRFMVIKLGSLLLLVIIFSVKTLGATAATHTELVPSHLAKYVTKNLSIVYISVFCTYDLVLSNYTVPEKTVASALDCLSSDLAMPIVGSEPYWPIH